MLVVVALGGSLLVSYARARGEVEGVLCNLGIMQRAERLLILGFGGLLDPSLAPRIGDGAPGREGVEMRQARGSPVEQALGLAQWVPSARRPSQASTRCACPRRCSST